MFRKSVFIATLVATTLSFSGTALAGSPNQGPNPCQDPIAMPEWCTNPSGDGTPGPAEPKPGHDITDFTARPSEDPTQNTTRPGGSSGVKAGTTGTGRTPTRR